MVNCVYSLATIGRYLETRELIKNKMVFVWLLVLLCMRTCVQASKKEDARCEIIVRETTYRVRLNDTICLPCKIEKQYADSRACLFYWKKDGSVVLQWPRYRVKPNKCLRIRNIRSSDHAKYVCYAQNECGTADAVRNLIVLDRDVNATDPPEPEPSTHFRPSVPVPPFFRGTIKRTAAVVHKHFYLGRRARLRCRIQGSPLPNIKWFHNGVSLEGSTLVNIRRRTFALVIGQFTTSHIGNYTCVGSNDRGVMNMSFVVTNKSGDPNPPLPITTERTVREGQNVTLRCRKPANRVKWLVWHPPNRELRKQFDKGRHKDYKPFVYPRSEPTKLVHDNGSVVEDFYLYNISRRMHAGVYRCLAVYKRSHSAVPVKIIQLNIQPDEKKTVISPSSQPSNEILLVKIAVPVMGSLLTLVVVVICFRCRRKTSMNNPVKAKADDEDDTLSMQILPTLPTGTLRIHKSLQEFTEDDAKFFGDIVMAKNSEETTNTAEREKSERASTKNSPASQHSFYQNPTHNKKPYAKTVSNGSCYSIPESNSSKKHSSSSENINPPPTYNESVNPPPWSENTNSNSSPCEKEVSNSSSCNKIPNSSSTDTSSKKHRHNKRQHNKRTKNDELPSNSNTSSYNSSHCGVVDDNIPALEIPESPEEEDQLLQREMRNWEPLIRDSTSYVCDRTGGDGESLRYDRTPADGETCRLLPPPSLCNELNLLTSRSDCSQHIVI